MGVVRNITREVRKAIFRASGGRRYTQRHYSKELAACLDGYRDRSDISDHLGIIFAEAVTTRPKLIVELGTRGGESTRVLIAAAVLCNASMLSVDLNPAPKLDVPGRERWSFVRSDDVQFASDPAGFRQWCEEHGHPPQADVIYIDTSHLYEHTCRELAEWNQYLAPAGALIFHDTNMGRGVFSRLDGTVSASGFNNERGVIRAIEEFLGRSYDERAFFIDVVNGYLVTHRPNCSGLTVLRRLG